MDAEKIFIAEIEKVAEEGPGQPVKKSPPKVQVSFNPAVRWGLMSKDEPLLPHFGKQAEEGGGEHQHFTEKTIHDKTKNPSKVKEIFRAVKREHPEYPAEYKARIAFKKGNKAKEDRKEGPPYEGPLAGK